MPEPILKGRGGANAVFEYKNPEKRGHVIRIRTSSEAAADDRVQALEQETWRETGLGEGPPLECDLRYINDVIGPTIGREYLAPQELVHLNGAEAILYGASSGVVMPDATLLPPPPPPSLSPPPLPTVCVELKPKFGSINACNTIRPEDVPLKHSNSRFRLHQALKAELRGDGDGAGSSPSKLSSSAYDPLDMFSGDSERIETALQALLACPQNNLALFIDGARAEGPAAVGAAAADLCPGSDEKEQACRLAALLRAILQQESVLSNVAAAQRACPYDIEGISRMYAHLLGDTGGEDCPPSCSEQAAAVAALLALPRAAAIGVLRSYVVSATAKDCSIMIAMRREAEGAGPRPAQRQAAGGWAAGGWLPLEVGGLGGIRYRVTVVDLDRKPSSKILKHLELDRRIVAAAWRRLATDPSAYSLQ